LRKILTKDLVTCSSLGFGVVGRCQAPTPLCWTNSTLYFFLAFVSVFVANHNPASHDPSPRYTTRTPHMVGGQKPDKFVSQCPTRIGEKNPRTNRILNATTVYQMPRLNVTLRAEAHGTVLQPRTMFQHSRTRPERGLVMKCGGLSPALTGREAWNLIKPSLCGAWALKRGEATS